MTGPGRYLTKLLRDSINFQEVGACDPVSTIALMLLKEWDLYAYKAEGVFIEEYHTFIVITINHVDYILDHLKNHGMRKMEGEPVKKQIQFS